MKKQISYYHHFYGIKNDDKYLYFSGDNWKFNQKYNCIEKVRNNKYNKTFVIYWSDAVVQPFTMVVKVNHTFVTSSAMLRIRPNIRLTYVTVVFQKITILFGVNCKLMPFWNNRVLAVNHLSMEAREENKCCAYIK